MWQQDGSRASWKEEKIRKEAIRLRGFYTILTKGNKFVEKSQDKGKGASGLFRVLFVGRQIYRGH